MRHSPPKQTIFASGRSEAERNLSQIIEELELENDYAQNVNHVPSFDFSMDRKMERSMQNRDRSVKRALVNESALLSEFTDLPQDEPM